MSTSENPLRPRFGGVYGVRFHRLPFSPVRPCKGTGFPFFYPCIPLSRRIQPPGRYYLGVSEAMPVTFIPFSLVDL